MTVHVVVVSTDPQQQLRQQQQPDDVTSSSSTRCLQTVVMVTVSLCVAVLLTLAVAMATLYALGARPRRRRSMTSSPAAAAFPVPVATGCRCGGGGADRRSWLVGCGGCNAQPSTDDRCKSARRHHEQLVNCADLTSLDGIRRPTVVSPTPASLSDHQPLNPTSNHSESTLLLVARDAWTS